MSVPGATETEVEATPLPVTFSIVGVQKAATSTLHDMLGRHRQIARGRLKERHFFDNEKRSWDSPDYGDYHTMRTKPHQCVTGDATPIYLFWPHSLERMRVYNPDMRLIASFRDPIERAFSQWSMERYRNPSFADFGYAIRDERFLDLPDDRAAAQRPGPIREQSLASRGLYGAQLRRGFESFEPGQWLMFDFRELIASPEGILDRVTDLLGLDRYRNYPALEQHNASQTDHRGAPPTADDVAWLGDFFAADLAEFAALSGVDTSAWPTARVSSGDLAPAELAETLARSAGLDPARAPVRRRASGGTAPRPGPSWLGIGAQRGGTTWLTDLLVQHPDVGVGTNGNKEQQALQKVSRGLLSERDYLDLFPPDSLLRGDFTPRYLNNASVPAVAARVVPDDSPIVVILRDPVERFASALRRRTKYAGTAWPYEAALAYGQWCGMYLPQLDLWASALGADRMLVYTYEAVRDDPGPMCAEIWRRLGLEPIDLAGVAEPSSSSAGHIDWQWPEGMHDSLVTLYRQQIDALTQRWGVRTDLWRSFA